MDVVDLNELGCAWVQQFAVGAACPAPLELIA